MPDTAIAITAQSLGLDTVRIEASHLDVPSETELGFALSIGGRKIAAVYTQGYGDSDAERSRVAADQLAPTFDGMTVAIPVGGADLAKVRPPSDGLYARMTAPNPDEVIAALALAFVAVSRERDEAVGQVQYARSCHDTAEGEAVILRSRVAGLLAACTKAVEHMELGEDISATRALRRAIAAHGGAVVAAPTKPAPDTIDPSKFGIVVDVVGLLTADPSKRIAIVCSSTRDAWDRQGTLLHAMSYWPSGPAQSYPTPIPGVRLNAGGGLVRMFVEGDSFGSFDPHVVIRDVDPLAAMTEGKVS